MASPFLRSAVRSFDHTQLCGLPSYGRLRKALVDLAKEATPGEVEMSPADWLAAVTDMALTGRFGDCCRKCRDMNADPFMMICFPHQVRREQDWLTCTYRCPRCERVWTCGYSMRILECGL